LGQAVDVQIERTSANSRKISGSITVPTPLEDVWAILTDYNRLAIHVPNLVESQIVHTNKGNNAAARRNQQQPQQQGQPGDGSYQCQLYQKGAQKIIGFEFGASVTMAMTESVLSANSKQIAFQCVDSFFFSGFDGEWRATERTSSQSGQVETVLSYTVDVRPKGPVPVAALEWRIREDVPTNLVAVKKAAMDVGFQGVMASRGPVVVPTSSKKQQPQRLVQVDASLQVPKRMAPTAQTLRLKNTGRRLGTTAAQKLAAQTGMASAVAKRSFAKSFPPENNYWDADETMAAYLKQ